MKISLMCIAKDEDNYIDEWINYHFKLGFDSIFVYQNQWNYVGNVKNENLILKKWDYVCDQRKLVESYDTFIKEQCNKYDWAFFLDCDEFLNIPGLYDIKKFMSNQVFDRVPSLAMHWRMFGDNGMTGVQNNNYSVLGRFTKCQHGFHRGHKSAINFNVCKDKAMYKTWCHVPTEYFPEFYMMDMQCMDKHSQYRDCPIELKDSIYINHYNVKTKQEFMENKQKRNIKLDPALYSNYEHNFRMCNFNDEENTSAKDFYFNNIK